MTSAPEPISPDLVAELARWRQRVAAAETGMREDIPAELGAVLRLNEAAGDVANACLDPEATPGARRNAVARLTALALDCLEQLDGDEFTDPETR